MHEVFHRIAHWTSEKTGSPWAFIMAFAAIILWLIVGPMFGFSDTWQLFINTGTTILTFLMVFLIQHTQNRDGKAVQLKLDELIKSIKEARDDFIDIEDLSDAEIEHLEVEFREERKARLAELAMASENTKDGPLL